MMELSKLKSVSDAIFSFNIASIHIAGSKGKGSTAMLISECLQSKNQKVGLFTSPYILDECECIKINGEAISNEDFNRLCLDFPFELSPFEKRTLVALRYFQEKNCDYAVIEAGWGGRRDATNIVESKVLTILTHVELEHVSTLGNSIELIMKEKLGITRPDVPLLTSVSQYEAVKMLTKVKVKAAKSMPLAYHHPESVGLALMAVKELGFNVEKSDLIRLEKLKLPGRFELQNYASHKIIMDGAHTRDSVDYFLKISNEYIKKYNFKNIIWSLHFLRDKADELSFHFPKESSFWITLKNESRVGSNPAKLKEISVADALELLSSKKIPSLMIVVGSFKLIAAFKKAISQAKN